MPYLTVVGCAIRNFWHKSCRIPFQCNIDSIMSCILMINIVATVCAIATNAVSAFSKHSQYLQIQANQKTSMCECVIMVTNETRSLALVITKKA